MPATKKPSGPPTVVMYNVGFGDCFLLSFPYTKANGGDRHLLIDFGSHPNPKGAPKGFMEDIANDIKVRCEGGKLAVVATHRHADHINGFTTNTNGTASGDIIRALKPEVVVQPWTEHPDAAKNAHKAPALRLAAVGFYESLAAMQSYAAALAPSLARLPAFLPDDLRRHLTFIGEDAVKNVEAVRNLMTMGKRKAQYVHAGTASGLETFLPGVAIHVLGPPTLEQEPDIGTYAKKSDQYWLRRRQIALGGRSARSARDTDRPLFPGAPRRRKGRFPAHASWFVGRLRQAYGDELLGIVTELDDVMNNTSVILLFEVAGQKLLFPGDAQLEDWTYALKQYRKVLDGVSVYKVGHHGSLNATPKALWRIMTEGDTAVPTAQFRTLMSTLSDVHGGKKGAPTEVPRGPLVDELRQKSKLTTTLDRDDFGKPQVLQL